MRKIILSILAILTFNVYSFDISEYKGDLSKAPKWVQDFWTNENAKVDGKRYLWSDGEWHNKAEEVSDEDITHRDNQEKLMLAYENYRYKSGDNTLAIVPKGTKSVALELKITDWSQYSNVDFTENYFNEIAWVANENGVSDSENPFMSQDNPFATQPSADISIEELNGEGAQGFYQDNKFLINTTAAGILGIGAYALYESSESDSGGAKKPENNNDQLQDERFRVSLNTPNTAASVQSASDSNFEYVKVSESENETFVSISFKSEEKEEEQ